MVTSMSIYIYIYTHPDIMTIQQWGWKGALIAQTSQNFHYKLSNTGKWVGTEPNTKYQTEGGGGGDVIIGNIGNGF